MKQQNPYEKINMPEEEESVNNYWERESEALETVKTAGGFKEFVVKLPEDRQEALFKRADTRLGCMDEGCDKCGFRLAGSGILFKESELDELAARAKAMGITEVTYHDGCGAAAKAGKDPEAFARMLAEKIGVPVSHIAGKDRITDDEKMSRPEAFHTSRVAYYDGTGRFNSVAARGVLPNGFVVTRALYPDAETAASEAQLAFDIASGHHGFGNLINSEEKFTVVVIGSPDDPEMSEKKLVSELEALAANPAIEIQSFTAPAAEVNELAKAA
jgi:hypothetical protein